MKINKTTVKIKYKYLGSNDSKAFSGFQSFIKLSWMIIKLHNGQHAWGTIEMETWQGSGWLNFTVQLCMKHLGIGSNECFKLTLTRSCGSVGTPLCLWWGRFHTGLGAGSHWVHTVMRFQESPFSFSVNGTRLGPEISISINLRISFCVCVHVFFRR